MLTENPARMLTDSASRASVQSAREWGWTQTRKHAISGAKTSFLLLRHKPGSCCASGNDAT
eukprot:1390068-Rhodomonas_salina.1